MFKLAWGTLTTTALSICMMLTWVGGAAAATPISACGTTLTVSGGYVLTGNLPSGDGNDCITVAANSVTIDFGGFVIDGAGSGSGVTDGGASHNSIVVRNGTIRGKANGRGIFLSSSTDVVVDGMVLAKNANGAQVGQGSVVKNSTIYDNSHVGVSLGPSSSLLDSTIHNTGSVAVSGGSHVTLARNTFTENRSPSSPFAIGLDHHASVHDNAFISNTAIFGHGVRVGPFSLVTRNTVLHTTSNVAIFAGPHSTVNDNVANANSGAGIFVRDHSSVIGNTAIGNGGDGIDVACPSTVKFNTAFGNTTNLNESGAGCTNVDNNAP